MAQTRNPRKKPLYAEANIDGMAVKVDIASMDPLRLVVDARKNRAEVFHVELRAKKAGLAALGTVLADPRMKAQLVQVFDTLGEAVKEITALPAPAPVSDEWREKLADRSRRAQEASKAAARAKAEELGILEAWEAAQSVEVARNQAWHAAYAEEDAAE